MPLKLVRSIFYVIYIPLWPTVLRQFAADLSRATFVESMLLVLLLEAQMVLMKVF